MNVTRESCLITTIIPTYRRPKLLRRAILSVLSQTFKNVRVCIYDNASDDDTKLVVQHIADQDKRVSYHCHSRNIGSYNNFNFGLERVDTTFFSLLSDDDCLAPEFYQTALEGFEVYPSAYFVCLQTMVINPNQSVLAAPLPVETVRFYSEGEGFKGMAQCTIPNTWTGILFKKKVIDGIGIINTKAGIPADGGWVYHAAARFPFVVIPKLGAVLLAHQASMSGTTPPIDRTWQDGWITIIRDIEQDKSVSFEVKKQARQLLHQNFRKIAFFQVVRQLTENSPSTAQKSAEGLRDCGYSLESIFLKCLIYICMKVPGFVAVLGFFRHQYQRKFHKFCSKQTVQFRNHLDFIEQLEKDSRNLEKDFSQSGKSFGCNKS